MRNLDFEKLSYDTVIKLYQIGLNKTDYISGLLDSAKVERDKALRSANNWKVAFIAVASMAISQFGTIHSWW